MGKIKIILFVNLAVFAALTLINLLTAFTPELGFDALWYHLTLPKLWLQDHVWYYPGGLLYYSPMPRLTETLFIPLIKYTGFVGPKLLQWLSGLGVCLFMWKITSRFQYKTWQKIVTIDLFYATWLVSWQSGSAYIDLFRTFLEIFALYQILKGNKLLAGVFLGLAIGTKWISIGSLALFSLIFGFAVMPVAILVSLPWFLIAFIYTGNPIYPIFSPYLAHATPDILSALNKILLAPLHVTFPYDDFLSPVVGVLLVLSAFSIFNKTKAVQKIALLAVLGTGFSLALNPPSSRFLLPYLPALAIASTYFVFKAKSNYSKIFVFIFTASAVVVLSLRLVAFQKYLPFLLGQQDTNRFLEKQSFRLPGTFIDSDDFAKNSIPQGSKILIDKLHNLYYFPLPFTHTSWSTNMKNYDYLVTEDENPQSIDGELMHTNSVGIQFFKLHHD